MEATSPVPRVAGRVAYAVWLLPLAALREDRRLRAAALAFTAYALLTRMPFAAPALDAVA